MIEVCDIRPKKKIIEIGSEEKLSLALDTVVRDLKRYYNVRKSYTSVGIACDIPEVIGYLIEKSIFPFIASHRVGELTFGDGYLDKIKKEWTLDIYGSEDFEIIRSIIENTVNQCGVELAVNLVNDKPLVRIPAFTSLCDLVTHMSG